MSKKGMNSDITRYQHVAVRTCICPSVKQLKSSAVQTLKIMD